MPWTTNGAQRASSDLPSPTGPVARSYPFAAWRPGADAQPARRLGAIDRRVEIRSQARPLAEVQAAAAAPTGRPILQARPVARPPARTGSSMGPRAILLPLIALLVSIGGVAAAPAPTEAATSRMKAVIIVGPAGSSTSRYLARGEAFADTAARHGMDVRRVFHPRATWSNVLENIQGAKLVIVLGHGNGWPSPYPPYQTNTKNGLGLNAYEGASAYSTKYYGEGPVSESIDLGTNAVVLLQNMCYTAGNGETGHAIPSESTARQRVDNYGAGFIKSGARAVFAYYWGQQDDFVNELMTRDATMDQIFMTRGRGDYDGYVGGRDVRFSSSRSKPYKVHMDRSNHGYLRSVVGNLEMTTDEWRGTAPAPDPDPEPEPEPEPDPDDSDTVAPKLTGLSTTSQPPATASEAKAGYVSPNRDGVREQLRLYHTLSEAAWLDTAVTRKDGTVVARYTRSAKSGRTSTTWDGRTSDGRRVMDGLYKLTVTPRDAAGNRGEAASVKARVMTAMRGPSLSDPLIYAADRDATASGATIKTFISDKATSVTFRVTTLDGTLVHERTPSLKASTSAYQWTWRGVDAAGERVPVGRYKLAVIVSSPAGDEWWGKTVFVGPFRVSVSTAHPSRGDELTFKVISTEPLEGAPTITVKQPNLKPYTVVTDATSKKATYQAEFKLSTAADAGRTTMTVSGVDENGQTQTRTIVVVVD